MYSKQIAIAVVVVVVLVLAVVLFRDRTKPSTSWKKQLNVPPGSKCSVVNDDGSFGGPSKQCGGRMCGAVPKQLSDGAIAYPLECCNSNAVVYLGEHYGYYCANLPPGSLTLTGNACASGKLDPTGARCA